MKSRDELYADHKSTLIALAEARDALRRAERSLYEGWGSAVNHRTYAALYIKIAEVKNAVLDEHSRLLDTLGNWYSIP